MKRKYSPVMKLVFVLILGFCCAFINGKPRPTLFIIGDSTVKNGKGDGSNGQWGWGSFLATYIDQEKIKVSNHAMGGTSTRTYYNNPKLWQHVLDSIQAGDVVIMQFGHNDASPIVDSLRARGSIKGNGDSFEEVYNPLLKQKEMVYSYGFYLRQFVKNIHDKGALAIICSPIPRNAWLDGQVRRSDYATWARQAAQRAGAFFIPLQDLVIASYEKSGQAFVDSTYFTSKDATHTIKEGAELHASIVAAYLRHHKEIGLQRYVKK